MGTVKELQLTTGRDTVLRSTGPELPELYGAFLCASLGGVGSEEWGWLDEEGG